MSTLASTLEDSLEIYADVILEPAFPEKELERLRLQLLTAIKREQQSPISMAQRVLPPLLYGRDHAYGNPRTGSGTLASVGAIGLDDVVDFHRTWFKPNHATMVVVGDTTLDEVLPQLEEHFGSWRPGDIPTKNLATVENPGKQQVYLVDRPGSQQSILFAAHLTVPKSNPDEIAIETVNDVLGGLSTSRINMNLREDKGWTYGAQTGLFNAKGQRLFFVFSSVQNDKTVPAMAEVMAELRGVVGENPVTQAELDKSVASRTLTLPGRWESAGAVLGSISQLVQYGLPDTYFDTYPTEVRALTVDEVNEVAGRIVQPENITWVIVGDRSLVEPELRDAGFGDVVLLDADVQPL